MLNLQKTKDVAISNSDLIPESGQPIPDQYAPQLINQWEELARVSALLERESLIRSAGVLELVSGLLSDISDTGGEGTERGDIGGGGGGGKNENKNSNVRHNYVQVRTASFLLSI